MEALVVLSVVLLVMLIALLWMGRQLLRQRKADEQGLGGIAARMLETQQTTGERLGQLAEATRQILEVGKDISSLQDILQPPKLRGGLGETLLQNMLSQLLPAESFGMPHQFSTGQVDAVIHLADGLVPVDAKFPLENFRKMLESTEERDKRHWRREFARDVRKHIDDISTKYILPDEGTLDFALMYIPAENIYYEIIVKDEGEESIADYALSKRVIPFSPNTFYAYLQAISIGLRGLRVEKYARQILADLTRLKGDFDSFHEHFRVLGTHLRRARDKYEDGQSSLDRFEDKLSSLEAPETIKQLPEEVDWPRLPDKAGETDE